MPFALLIMVDLIIKIKIKIIMMSDSKVLKIKKIVIVLDSTVLSLSIVFKSWRYDMLFYQNNYIIMFLYHFLRKKVNDHKQLIQGKGIGINIFQKL